MKDRIRSSVRGPRLVGLAAVGMVALAVGLFAAVGDTGSGPTPAEAAGCKIYVASGDNVTNGDKMNDNAKRYPEQLVANKIKTPGWCLYNQAKNGQTSSSYISGGGLSIAYNMRPDLLTIQLGEQNATIVNLISSCFDKIKDHDFSGGNACAAQILGNQSLFDNLRNNYTTILQQTRIMHAQRPGLVVAVVNYPNPYPKAETATLKIAQLCPPLVDTAGTCNTRWAQLPPALLVIDQVFQKLNTTLKNAMGPFNQASSGNRWVYVDTYTKMRDHCMKMDVSIQTTVQHGNFVDAHASNADFGCTDPWFVEGSVGTKEPGYLDPAVGGTLLTKTQQTRGMGVYPDSDGHKCISEAIWEADTIDPGTTPLKWKLGYGEASNPNICQ